MFNKNEFLKEIETIVGKNNADKVAEMLKAKEEEEATRLANIGKEKANAMRGELKVSYASFRKAQPKTYNRLQDLLNCITLWNMAQSGVIDYKDIDKVEIKSEDIEEIKTLSKGLLLPKTYTQLCNTSNTAFKSLFKNALMGACNIRRRNTAPRKASAYNYETVCNVSVFEFMRNIEKLLYPVIKIEK